MEERDTGGLPLSGIRVLDISQGIAGPYTGFLLGRQGASVVKVEPPSGDWGRRIGAGTGGLTGLSVAMNGGKYGVCLDAAAPAGKAALGRMARAADVVIENFRPGVAARLGIDHATLSVDAPGVVVVSISGFGTEGPSAKRPGSDTVMQATSGMMTLNADEEGRPRLVPMYVIDTVAALYAAGAVNAALFERARTGRGREIAGSLLAAAAAFQAVPMLDDALSATHGASAPPVPSGVFDTDDGLIRVTSLSDATFAALARCLDRPGWPEGEEYGTDAARRLRAEALVAEIAAILRERTTAEWLEILAPAGVLCAAVNDYDAFRADPQVVATGLFREVDQPGLGTIPLPATPFAPLPPAPAPAIGAHTRAGLAALGLAAEEIEALIAEGIAVEAAP